VNAAEDLLRHRPFEDISVAEICRAADVTTGAYYARFASKEALMPFIYERYQHWLVAAVPGRFAEVNWAQLDFEQTGEQVAALLVAFYHERPWLLRATALFVRTRPGDVPSNANAIRAVLVEAIAQVFAPHLRAGEETDAAVRFACHAAMSATREIVVFSSTSVPAAMTERERLAREVGSLMTGYLRSAGVTAPKRRKTT
jgi:AcrR family transcriptional regulator